jgi:hypothetical protein
MRYGTALHRLGIAGVATLMVGCHSDAAAWRAQLAAAGVQRLAGTWEVELRLDVPDALARHSVTGHLALVLNDARLDAAGLGARPQFFGTYDIDFAPLRLQLGVLSGVPTVIGLVADDSLAIQLAPSADFPVELRGVAVGDSVVGRWSAHMRHARARPRVVRRAVLR